MVRALFPGSFDPVTLGHVDLIRRSLRLFESVTVGVGANVAKSQVFDVDQRLDLLRASLVPASPALEFCVVPGLVVDFCRDQDIQVLIRGVRSAADLAAETQLAQMNRKLDDAVDTVLLLTAPEHSFVSSSLIRDIARHGGDVSAFVPPAVAQALIQRYPKP